VLRSISLVRLTLTGNRAAGAIAEIFSRHGIQYVLSVTVIIILLSSAGVFYFEGGETSTSFHSFGDALWWSTTMVTTINIGIDPVTVEGRVIGVLLRAYAVAIFGYIAGSIASYLVGQRVAEVDATRQQSRELTQLSEELDDLNARLSRILEEGSEQNAQER
jgi:voltage-gated potassium channel